MQNIGQSIPMSVRHLRTKRLCLKSSLLHMQMGELNDEELARSSDGRDFLAKCPGIK